MSRNRIEITWFEGYSTKASLEVATEDGKVNVSTRTVTPELLQELHRVLDAVGSVLSIGASAPVAEGTDDSAEVTNEAKN